MKVTIITVVLNSARYIAGCIDSILMQQHPDIEYIILDGASTDGTVAIIEKYLSHIFYFESVKDDDFYSTLNRGLSIANGEIIGILNADDVLADPSVVSIIVKSFLEKNCDAVYGNLNYTKRDNLNTVIRTWRSKKFQRHSLKYGWMPPHPTVYLKKGLFSKLGNYSSNYGASSDYELILRFFYKHRVKAVFVDKLFVKMRLGGVSNSTFKQRLKAITQDYNALLLHNIPYPLIAVIGKKVRKIEQFF
jgi:glycosyltransferase involved in cell wall biosynthesis